MQTRLLLAALALAAAALPRNGTQSQPALATLTLSAGPAGRVTLINQTLAPLQLSQCAPTLEAADGAGWKMAGADPGGCGEPRQLMPGDSGTLSFACPTAPGTYRLALPVSLERPSLEPLSAVARSATFRIPARSPGSPCA